jgi:hypothetical protein
VPRRLDSENNLLANLLCADLALCQLGVDRRLRSYERPRAGWEPYFSCKRIRRRGQGRAEYPITSMSGWFSINWVHLLYAWLPGFECLAHLRECSQYLSAEEFNRSKT